MKKVKLVAESIARELADQSVFSVDRASKIIESRINDSLSVILSDYNSKLDEKMLSLKIEATRTKGTPRYQHVGLEISKLKHMMATVNRARSAAEVNQRYASLRDWVLSKYGQEALNSFYRHFDTITEKAA